MSLNQVVGTLLAIPGAIGLFGYFRLTFVQPEKDPTRLSSQRNLYWICCLVCTVFLPACSSAYLPHLDMAALSGIATFPPMLFVSNGVMRTRFVVVPFTGGKTLGPVWPNGV